MTWWSFVIITIATTELRFRYLFVSKKTTLFGTFLEANIKISREVGAQYLVFLWLISYLLQLQLAHLTKSPKVAWLNVFLLWIRQLSGIVPRNYKKLDITIFCSNKDTSYYEWPTYIFLHWLQLLCVWWHSSFVYRMLKIRLIKYRLLINYLKHIQYIIKN